MMTMMTMMTMTMTMRMMPALPSTQCNGLARSGPVEISWIRTLFDLIGHKPLWYYDLQCWWWFLCWWFSWWWPNLWWPHWQLLRGESLQWQHESWMASFCGEKLNFSSLYHLYWEYAGLMMVMMMIGVSRGGGGNGFITELGSHWVTLAVTHRGVAISENMLSTSDQPFPVDTFDLLQSLTL